MSSEKGTKGYRSSLRLTSAWKRGRRKRWVGVWSQMDGLEEPTPWFRISLSFAMNLLRARGMVGKEGVDVSELVYMA